MNIFPLFFTLESVENGYILTSKEEREGLTQEPKYRKEVVTNDRIDSRIGHLLCLDTLVKEHPVVFHIEVVGEKTYKIEDLPSQENLMVAKLSFAHFSTRKYQEETIVLLHIEDTNMIEIYGRDAERIADTNDIAISRCDGIPFLRFPNTKEGMKTLASFVRNPSVINVSESQIMDWYNSHRIKQTKSTRQVPPANNKNNNSPSNASRK